MIFESLRIALRQFLRRPVRSLLVLQGITWGVALAVFFPALIEGSRDHTLARGSELGIDRVVLKADPTGDPLGLDDLEALQEELGENLLSIAAIRLLPIEIFGGQGGSTLTLLAEATPEFPSSRSYPVAQGRFPPAGGESTEIPVAIEPTLATELFGSGPIVGSRLEARPFDPEWEEEEAESHAETVPARKLRVVGLMSQRSEETLGANDLGLDVEHELAGLAKSLLRSLGIVSDSGDWKRSDRVIYAPLGALASADQPLSEIVFRATPATVERVSEAAQLILADRGIVPLALTNLGYRAIMTSEIDRYEILNVALFTTVLIMGTFMIANITLFSVMERYKEIAIRRVEGATRRAILMQFLFEGLVLCLVGGLIGVPLGLGLAKARSWLDPGILMTARLPIGRSLLAVGLATLAGVLASILPARRAARIEPVEALRHE